MSLSTATEMPFGNLTRQLNKMMEQVQKGFYTFCPSETWTPSVNVYETERDYHISVDLAGVDKEKIDLSIHDRRLTIKGYRAVPTCEEVKTEESNQTRIRVHVMEIDHGGFCREVELPHDVHRDNVNANYDNGMLWIHLPKK